MEGILPWAPLYLHHVKEGFGKMKVHSFHDDQRE